MIVPSNKRSSEEAEHEMPDAKRRKIDNEQKTEEVKESAVISSSSITATETCPVDDTDVIFPDPDTIEEGEVSDDPDAPKSSSDTQEVANDPSKKEKETEVKPDDWQYAQRLWTCSDCGALNYSSKTSCHKCDAPKPEKVIRDEAAPPDPQKPPSVTPTPVPSITPMLKPGDLLGNILKKRESAPKAITNGHVEAVAPAPPAPPRKRRKKSRFDVAPATATEAEGQSSQPKPMTWECFHCKMMNVPSAKQCWRCSAAHMRATTFRQINQPSTTPAARPIQELRVPERPKPKMRYEIFVGNLSQTISEDILRQHFSEYSPILSCRKPNDTYGFIEFSSMELTNRAMQEMNGKYIFEQRIRCQWPKRRGVEERTVVNNNSQGKKRLRFEVFVGNLSTAITEMELETQFSTFGKVINVRKPASFAFIRFASLEGAVNAVTVGNGVTICGRRLNVQWPKDFDTELLSRLMNGTASDEDIKRFKESETATRMGALPPVTNRPAAPIMDRQAIALPVANNRTSDVWYCPRCRAQNFTKDHTCANCHKAFKSFDEHGNKIIPTADPSRFQKSLATKVSYF